MISDTSHTDESRDVSLLADVPENEHFENLFCANVLNTNHGHQTEDYRLRHLDDDYRKGEIRDEELLFTTTL